MEKKFYLSLKMRLILLMFVIVIPLTFMVTGYQRMFEKYSRSYNEIMANLKVAMSIISNLNQIWNIPCTGL